ncbi:M48 family metalloprotease [Microcoleus sp. FACHB-SPT15]|uniref:M48 family metallopeptidase n=1 Tax=Microcoleus sp. FACHB-SPT15 TaxID=2692830 RepID=UPI001786D8C7|nr:M48 family metallopeptidase [Microcoleus sp. FACHB-SPT15]MBD1804276.1 M48 family metalloprotease [Microcoleus sp. FACHB-SPT15]
MLNLFFFLSRRYQRRWLYPLISVVMALSLVLGSPQVTQARPWFDLIFRGVQILQLSNISNREEIQIGQQINQQLVGSEIQLYRNSEINRYVDQIGQRLAQESSRTDIPYKFQVVNDKNINAFATMGGFVYVNTGLLTAADNEAQLASVMAHEIGHIAGRHAIGQMRQQAIAQGVAAAAGLDRNLAVQIGVDLALRRPHSRQDEVEADELGLDTLQNAGYAPVAMVDFMEKLLKKGGSVPTFLSTHPATSDRINALERAIDPARSNVGDGLDTNAYRSKIRALL